MEEFGIDWQRSDKSVWGTKCVDVIRVEKLKLLNGKEDAENGLKLVVEG